MIFVYQRGLGNYEGTQDLGRTGYDNLLYGFGIPWWPILASISRIYRPLAIRMFGLTTVRVRVLSLSALVFASFCCFSCELDEWRWPPISVLSMYRPVISIIPSTNQSYLVPVTFIFLWWGKCWLPYMVNAWYVGRSDWPIRAWASRLP